jgi:N-methylhydantoinase B
MTLSACAVSLKAVFPHLPQNQGVLNAIELEIRPGSVLDASFPGSVNGTFATTYEKVVGAVFGCLLQVVPQRCMVGSGNISNLCVGGHDPRPGHDRDYVLYVWREAGYGARPGKKDNHTAMSLYSSGTRNEPVELMERMFPVLSSRYEFITDSGGSGRHRGGLGVARDFVLTHGDGDLTVMGDRGVIPAWGFDGGLPGLGSGLVYAPGSDHEVNIGMMASGVLVQRGVEIAFTAGGGGGWGDPRTRPAEWVLDDVIDGFVSVEKAREVYGVEIVVAPDDPYVYVIDEAATAKARDGHGGARA